DTCAGKLDGRGLASETRIHLLVTFPRHVGVQRQYLASVFDDRELIDQPLELRDQVSRNEYRATAWGGVLIRTDDRADEFAPDDRIEAGRRLVADQQVRLGADRRDERELRPL